MGLGIFDTVNGSIDPSSGLGTEEDYNLTVDLTAGMTVSGNFDSGGGGDFDTYTFTQEPGGGGILTSNSTTGVWSFESDGTATFGDTFTFTVSIPGIDFGGDVGIIGDDSDTVTITFTCFASGTLIDTASGARAIESLAKGDQVLTKDHGPQTLRWVGSRELIAPGDLGAIVISAGALGNTAELRVSPAHRILLSGWRAEVLTGHGEVLVAARDLINGDTIWQDRQTPVTYYHMLFDTHQIVTSDGVHSESYHPTTTGLADLSPATKAEVLALFPQLATDPATYGPAARPVLTSGEAVGLLA